MNRPVGSHAASPENSAASPFTVDKAPAGMWLRDTVELASAPSEKSRWGVQWKVRKQTRRQRPAYRGLVDRMLVVNPDSGTANLSHLNVPGSRFVEEQNAAALQQCPCCGRDLAFIALEEVVVYHRLEESMAGAAG